MHHTNEDVSDSDTKPVDSKKSLITILVIVAIVIGILAAIIIFGKYSNTNKNIVVYNNYTFEKFEGNKWMTQQLIKEQLYNIPFYNNPTEILDIPVDAKSINRVKEFSFYKNGTVYITVDPDASSRVVLAGVEYARLLGDSYNIYNMRVKSAISRPMYGSNTSQDVAVVNCGNESYDNLIIYQVISDKNLVSINRNCITLESKNATEAIRVADAFAFRLLNIIQE
jgi:hypothetical protein